MKVVFLEDVLGIGIFENLDEEYKEDYKVTFEIIGNKVKDKLL